MVIICNKLQIKVAESGDFQNWESEKTKLKDLDKD